MADREFDIETLCLHAGQLPDAATGARATPIYQSAAYVFDSADHAASLFNLQTFGNVYSRISNPTNAVFEERMAALEGGRAAVATASGLAANIVSIMALLTCGDEIVAGSTLYGGTYTQFDVNLRNFGINTTFVDPDRPKNFRDAITDKTRIIYAETIGNPRNNVLDIEAVAAISAEANIPLFVDNTVATPYLCRPIEYGADIVVHSATKYIGGHGTSIGGVVVESGKFPWDNGNFPAMTEPFKGYHGIRFYETFGDFAYTMKARFDALRSFGPALSPFNAFLFLQGLETLHLRMQRHCENALAVARFLEEHQGVKWVNYPGLASSDYYELAQKYLHKGASSIVTFGIAGADDAGVKFIENAQFMSHLANIGDAKTLIIHPASTTHRQLNEEERQSAGVTSDMIRISVGLESIDDIQWDLDQALSAAAA